MKLTIENMPSLSLPLALQNRAFVQLKQLEYLNLSGNHALSSLPSLSHCLHLHTLCLHSTLISTLPERKLVTLDLARNKISQLPTVCRERDVYVCVRYPDYLIYIHRWVSLVD